MTPVVWAVTVALAWTLTCLVLSAVALVAIRRAHAAEVDYRRLAASAASATTDSLRAAEGYRRAWTGEEPTDG